MVARLLLSIRREGGREAAAAAAAGPSFDASHGLSSSELKPTAKLRRRRASGKDAMVSSPSSSLTGWGLAKFHPDILLTLVKMIIREHCKPEVANNWY